MNGVHSKTAVALEDPRRSHLSNGSPESRSFTAVMSDKVFRRLSELIHGSCGIRMPLAKKTMLEGRLRKRIRALRLESYEQYCEYLFSTEGFEREFIHMIDAVTTNKTDFFREPDHFDYLFDRVLPELVGRQGLSGGRRLNVWSAGCSTGEEPYTLAMVLSEFAGGRSDFQFSVLATDISTAVLDTARSGIYDEEKVAPIPLNLRRKYLLRGKDRRKGLVRVARELRGLVRFRRVNFLEDDYGIKEAIGVIFCRNVIIYFDRPTQQKILKRFSELLLPGGYLFIGHSESLHGMELPLVQTAATVYRKPGQQVSRLER